MCILSGLNGQISSSLSEPGLLKITDFIFCTFLNAGYEIVFSHLRDITVPHVNNFISGQSEPDQVLFGGSIIQPL